MSNSRKNNFSYPFISIITPTNRDHYMDKVFDNYSRQDYPNKEMIIVLNKNSMSLAKWKNKAKDYLNVKVFQLDEENSLGACKNYGIEQSKYDYIAHFDDDDYYAPNYLNNAMSVFSKVDTDIVGKATTYAYLEAKKMLVIYNPSHQNMYINRLPDATLVYKRSVFDRVKFAHMNLGVEHEFEKRCLDKGFKLYSGDKYDYVIFRASDKSQHTWKDDDHILLFTSQVISITENYEKLVVDNRLLKLKSKKKQY